MVNCNNVITKKERFQKGEIIMMKKRGMKLWSKVVAVCLVLALTISVGLPAMAATIVDGDIKPTSTGTINVTGKETEKGATVTAYQIITVNAENGESDNGGTYFQPLSPMYTWVDSIAAWLKTYTADGETYPFAGYVGDANEVTKAFSEINGSDKTTFYVTLRDAIGEMGDLTSKTTTFSTEQNNPTAKFTDMAMGQWFIVITPNQEHAGYEYAPAIADLTPKFDEIGKVWKFEDVVEVVAKSNPGIIEKDVDDYTVEIGQTVTYTLNVPVPYYPDDAIAEMFRIGDKVSEGITVKNNSANNMQIIAVYESGSTRLIGTSETERDDDYNLYYNGIDYGYKGDQEEGYQPPKDEEGNPINGQRDFTFMIDFDYDNLMEEFGYYEESPLQNIQVTYEGTINENAIISDDSLLNEAYIGQNNDPYDRDSYTPTTDEEKLYTYGIDLAKVEEDGKTPLPGAEFELRTKGNDPSTALGFIKEEGDGNYRRPQEGEEASATTTLVVGSQEGNVGKLLLQGLATGKYYLVETKAPDGYELLTDPIEVNIVDKEADDSDYDYGKNPIEGAGTIDDAGDIEEGSNITNIYYKTVINTKPPVLPLTGGMGTIIFSTVGIILMAGGIALVVSYRRRRHA